MSLIILNVDEVRRTLSASGGAFVTHDKEVDIVRFAINSGFADIVLDGQVALRVMYQRPGETEVRAKTLTYYDTDGLHNYYDWQLLSADLAEKGALTVALCILRTDGDVEEWHTTPCQISVLNTIHTDDSDEADETITPTVSQRVAVLETMIQRVASGAPIVVSSTSAMTDTSQIYVLSTDGNWYYHNGSAWVSGGTYGAVATDTTLTQPGIPADAKAVGDAINAVTSDVAEVQDALEHLEVETDKTLSIEGKPADAEAVGDEISAIKADLGNLSDLGPVSEIPYIEKTIGEKFVAAQQAFSNVTWKGGYFNPTTGVIATDSRYKYTDEYFDIGILAAIKSVYLKTGNIACVVFYDASKEIVGTINQTSNDGLIVTSIAPPENAVYFRICQPTANTDPFPLSTYVVGDLFAKAETDLPVDIESVLTAQGGIDKNGILATYSAWKVTDFIKVSPGMFLKYSGCGNIGTNTLCPIAFYDSSKKPILVIKPDESNFVYMRNKGWSDASASGTSIHFGFVLVPPSAHYCRVSGYGSLRPSLEVATVEPWAGKKCVFFGDSITAGTSTTEKYSNFIAMLRGITVANYGVGGGTLVDNCMSRVTAFVTDYTDNPADAFIFAYGTNDWYNGKLLGEWYTTDNNGVRTLTTDTTTFRGAWVQILTYLKTNFDGKKIILMTPIHRGSGSYTSDLTRNNKGLYLEDYVNVIKEAGEIFSVDVIDLYGESGLTPDINPNTAYFTGNDRLHPNAEGHKQMAKVISAKMGQITI